MKRNMELCRLILLKMNEHEHGYAPDNLSIESFSDEEVGYHCLLLDEAGLIQATETTSKDAPSPAAIPLRLTWEGHEFIDNAQNSQIWDQTKEVIAKIGDASFSVWTSVLSKTVVKSLELIS